MSAGKQSKSKQEAKETKPPHREQVEEIRPADLTKGRAMTGGGCGLDSTESQASLLKRLDRVQRREMVSNIGRIQGNKHVQRLMDIVNQDAGELSGLNEQGVIRQEVARESRISPVKLTVPHGSDLISRRRATAIERQAWLSIFDHPIPQRLLNNYMDDTGAEVTLSLEEMVGINVDVDVRRIHNRALHLLVQRLREAGGGRQSFSAHGSGVARTNGTLGQFTINYIGLVEVEGGNWRFQGRMNFYDIWDFDPRPFLEGNRTITGEIRTRIGAYGLPGRPFTIRSVNAAFSQENEQEDAIWRGNPVASAP